MRRRGGVQDRNPSPAFPSSGGDCKGGLEREQALCRFFLVASPWPDPVQEVSQERAAAAPGERRLVAKGGAMAKRRKPTEHAITPSGSRIELVYRRIQSILTGARTQAWQAVNQAMVAAYWEIGRVI